MSGNAWEWCWDWYGGYSSGVQTDPKGATSGSNRVLRGGSFGNYSSNCRVANRNYYVDPYVRGSYNGFRCSSTISGFPAIPQILTATAGNSQVTLKWSKNVEADFLRYRIYMGADSTTMSLKDSSTASISDTTKTITGLTNGTKYYFRVSALDSARLESGKSFAVSATPSALSDLVQVTGGTFQMGSNDANDWLASPQHSVTLSSFRIDKYEITYEKWTEVRNWALTHGYASADIPVGLNGSTSSGTNNPVDSVAWYDIVKWCNARSEMDGLTPIYYTSNTLATVYRTGQLDLATDAVNWNANGYRLPTEAEWEFAARGGNQSHGYTYSGSNTIDNVAWYLDNTGYTTHQVGQKIANELGIYDMSGNVYEWCWDRYGAYSSAAQTDPKGPASGGYRICRGGSFYAGGVYCRVAYRYYGSSSDRYTNSGFRCASRGNTAPTIPQNLTAAVGNSQVTLKWNKNTESDFLKYRVYLGADSTTMILKDSSAASISDTSKTITDLTNGTKYYFRISALDSARLESGRSFAVSATPFGNATVKGEYNPDANTVLLLHMNETSGSTVSDASSYGNGGAATGTAIGNGRFGKARNYNGVSDWVRVPNSTTLQIANAITLEAWINLNAQDLDWNSFISKMAEGYGAVHGYDLRMIAGHPMFTLVMPSGTIKDHEASGGPIPVGKWIHLAGTYDGAKAKIFLNGLQIYEGNHNGNLSIGSEDLYIGKQNVTSNDRFTNAIIDEVRISNIARLPQEFNLQLPPVYLSASGSGGIINLSWQNGGGAVPLMKYKIYRGSDSTNVSLIDSTVATSSSNSPSKGGTYYYRVSAVDSTGFESTPSYAAKETASNVLAAPQNLTATASNGQVTLKWSKNTESDFLRYRIYGGTPPNPTTKVDSTFGGISDTTKEISKLSNGVLYYFRITAVDTMGLESGYSNEVNAKPNIQSPTLLVFNLATRSVQLNWNTISGAQSYRIYRGMDSSSVVLVGQSSGNTFLDTLLVPSQRYFYRISAVDSSGVEGTQSPALTVHTNPEVPINLTSMIVTDTSFSFSWQSGGGNPTNYRVYRSLDGITYNLRAAVTQSSYLDTGLVQFTPYWYQMSALNGIGVESGLSIPLKVVTLRALPRLTITMNTTAKNKRIVIPYTLVVGTQDSIKIVPLYSVNGGKSFDTLRNTVGVLSNITMSKSDTLVWESSRDYQGETDSAAIKIVPIGISGTGYANATPLFRLDNRSPQFGGLQKALSDSMGTSVNLSWGSARDISIPVKYLIYESGLSGTINYNSPIDSISADTVRTIPNLTPFSKYYFGVRAKDNLGNIDTNTIAKLVVPSRAVQLRNLAIPSGIVRLQTPLKFTIEAALEDTVSVEPHYSTNGGVSWNIAERMTGKTVGITRFGIENTIYWDCYAELANREEFSMKLRVVPSGRGGAGLAVATDKFVLDTKAPVFGGLASVVNNSLVENASVTLSWNPATDTTKPIKYFVYSSFVKNGEDFQNPLDSTNVLTYKAGQLDNNKEYFFVVRARDGIGNLDSNRVEKSLFVPPLADFNADRKIDGEDLAIFRKAWKEKNASVGDIGPVQGTVPNFKVLRDGKVDFEDIIVFAQMWNWSSDNSSWALSKGNTSRSLDTSTCKVGFVEPLIIKPSRQQAFTLQVNNALDYSTCEISFRYNRAKIRIDSIKIPQCSDVVRLWKLDDKNGKGLIALTSLDQKLNKLINSTSNIRLWISTTEKLIDEPIAITVRTFSDSAAVNSYTTTELHMNWRPVVPDEYALLQNYPNPFNPNTVIEYSLPTDTRVRLAVYNILGQEVSTLADGSSKAGYYTINWNGISNDGSQVGSGVYIYRLVTKDYSATRKMLLLR